MGGPLAGCPPGRYTALFVVRRLGQAEAIPHYFQQTDLIEVMETRHRLAPLRERAGSLLYDKKLVIAAEMAVVLLVLALPSFLPLPNTVIPLFLLGWISLWLRRFGWRDLGFCRPRSWFPTVLTGIVIGGFVVLFSKALLPIVLRLVGETYEPSGLCSLESNLPLFLALLASTWPLGAVMEELVYRGYVLNRLTDLFGRSKRGWGISIMLSALMFSLAHGVYSPWLILAISLQGLLLGGLYLIGRRNLWLPIIAHGAGITINITLAFLGIV